MRRSIYQRKFFSGSSLHLPKPVETKLVEDVVDVRLRLPSSCICSRNAVDYCSFNARDFSEPESLVKESNFCELDTPELCQGEEKPDDSRRSSFYFSEAEEDEKFHPSHLNRMCSEETNPKSNWSELNQVQDLQSRDEYDEQNLFNNNNHSVKSFKSGLEKDFSTFEMTTFKTQKLAPYADPSSKSFDFGFSPARNLPNRSPQRILNNHNFQNDSGISRRESFKNFKKMAADSGDDVSCDSEMAFWKEFPSPPPKRENFRSNETDSFDFSRLENAVASLEPLDSIETSNTDFESFCEAVTFSAKTPINQEIVKQETRENSTPREKVDNEESPTKDLSPKLQCRVL